MFRLIAVIVALVCTLTPALAETERSRDRIVECRLVIDRRDYIRGPCTFSRIDRDGSFQIMARNGRTFAQVLITGRGVGEGYWNGGRYGTHAHAALGTLRRDNACWANDRVSICAR